MICLSFTSACHERNANYSTELFNDSLATDVLVHGYPGTLTTLTSNIDLNIELYIGTRGRTGNATCTNATGPQGDTRAILYDGNIEYELRGVLAKYTLCGL